ncbi:hypothetical protein QB910_000067 [Dabrowskivirus KKP3916]|uniref:DNA methyltransferase n=1 Tax=Alicyclobacillus phage KKP_3916 TaxID=3040651 RepID=A0AAT9V7M7_9CAUD|nr:hypothetical protein QB910_000067 [Alicyclobacillus phage KKP 3916]
MLSATNRGAKRNDNDFYPTPTWVTEELIKKLIIPKSSTCLEPCVGDGAIWNVIKPYFSSMGWAELSKGRDFLTYDFGNNHFDFVITNPPFSLAEEFICRSLELADCVVMLLRLNFLGGQKRYDRFWSMPKYKPTGQIICSDRPSFTGKGNGRYRVCVDLVGQNGYTADWY